MIVVLFEIRARADVDEAAYEGAFERMLELVHEVPGFTSFSSYASEDGVELAVARFEDDIALGRWREQAEHVLTRRRGHDEFFDAYDITIATEVRRYAWKRPLDTGAAVAEPGG